MNLDQLTEQVWQRMHHKHPSALLIGKAPPIQLDFDYVNFEPYEAIVLGILQPGELLHMPNDAVCCALLAELPVWLWPEQPYKKAKAARALCAELSAAERHLRQLGVRMLQEKGTLITAQEARRLQAAGKRPPHGSRLTPLAKEILREDGG